MTEFTIPLEVHSEIAVSFAREYLEAVVADAMRILPAYLHRQDTRVVIHHRGIAVIFDKQAERGAAIPVRFNEQVIDGDVKRNLQTWLEAPPNSFYVMHLAGSWFPKT